MTRGNCSKLETTKGCRAHTQEERDNPDMPFNKKGAGDG